MSHLPVFFGLNQPTTESQAQECIPSDISLPCAGENVVSTPYADDGILSLSNSSYGPDSPSSKKTTIHSLPDEVLIKVLSAVSSSAESPAEMVTPSMICRKWRRVARDREVLQRTSRKGMALHAKQWSTEAFLYLRKLCGVGCLEACFTLGMILFYCIPGAQMEGGRILIQTARLGHAAALHASGIMSFNGSGMGKNHKDLKMGVSLIARGAALGHVDAMRELGHCLLDGFGVKQDQIEGWRMMLKAHMVENGLLPMVHEQYFSKKRKHSAFDSPCHVKRFRSQTLGNSEVVPGEAQQQALQQLLHPLPMKTLNPRIIVKPVVHNPWATPSSSSSNPSTPPGPAIAGKSMFSREEAQKLLRVSVSQNQNRQASSTACGMQSVAMIANEDSSSKIDYLKALEVLLASGKKISTEASKKLKNLLSGFQTSSSAAEIHPAHNFIMEWYGLVGHDEAKGSLAEGLGFCSRATCGRPETRQMEFWRCSTCWSARYCSRSCQLHDWRLRHCKECRGNADGHERPGTIEAGVAV